LLRVLLRIKPKTYKNYNKHKNNLFHSFFFF
jgi:hypothetical protein